MSAQFSPKRNYALIAVMLAVTALVSACDRPSDVAAPGDLTPQMAPGGSTTTVRFVVTRANNGQVVAGATVSVYFNNTQTYPLVACDDETRSPTDNCWLTTDANGVAEVDAAEGVGIGYLARVLPENWIQQANEVWPPATPPVPSAPGAHADLGALTCSRTAPVPANAGTIEVCFNELYLKPRGDFEVVALALPFVQSQTVTVYDPDGEVINSGLVYAHLIEALPQGTFPWLTGLPDQVFPGFLRYYAPGLSTSLPAIQGQLEVYGKSAKGYDVAASAAIGTTGASVTALPVVCTNPDLSLAFYTLDGAQPNRAQNSEFHFPDGKWAYGATRVPGSANALDPNLTTTVVALETYQTILATVTVSFSQRFRTSSGPTNTASGTATCTLAGCDVVSVDSPGADNPMDPSLFYEAATKRLFWVVTGLNDPLAVSEWSVKATRPQGNRTVVLDQWPVPSKSNTSAAFQIFSDALKTAFCDPRPEWSYDGGWGCGI